jgi:hypothetical protein
LKFHNLLLGTLVSSIISCNVVANSFGVPERPSNTSPSSSEVGVTTLPTLTSSDFVIKNDAGAVQANTVLTESEWLVYENTGVTLVGGGNLTGSDRDNGDTVYFDVSSSNVSLAGSVVYYAYVNHKRLELTGSSHGLLGYVELPDFIWQADDKDPYLATRFKQSDGAVVIEWTYGDASAATPWELTLQAVLNEGLIGLKIKEDTFTADFVTAYGSEQIGLCDEASCFGHDFTTIYNTGNAITCSLVLESDTCSGAALHSGAPLSDMSITEIAYGTSATNTYTLPSSLNDGTEYYWVSRQKGTLNSGAEIAGGWSNETSFTTEGELVIPEATYDANVIAAKEHQFIRGRNEVVQLIFSNDSSVTADTFEFTIDPYPLVLDDIVEWPASCEKSVNGYELSCAYSNIPAGWLIDFEMGMSVTQGTDADLSVGIHTRINDQEVDYTNLNLGQISNLSQVTDITIEGMFDKDIYNVGQIANLQLDFLNRSDISLQDDAVIVFSSFNEFNLTETSRCTTHQTIVNQYGANEIECNVGAAESSVYYLQLLVPKGDIETFDLSVEVCDVPVQGTEYCVSQAFTTYFQAPIDNSEEGGSIWLLPLLGLFLRRKNISCR